MLFRKPLDQLDKSDIDALVASGEPEGKTLDYKEALAISTDGEKKEFLKDVASFANANGGYLIFGITEKRDSNNKQTGQPEAAVGLNCVTDQTLITIADVIREGIDPRIQGMVTKVIPGFPLGPVIVLHVQQSWARPHMVYFRKNESRFWSRHSNGKYFLDADEIRSAFALSESLTDRIKAFRQNRLDAIIGDDIPARIGPPTRAILHLLPISAFDRAASFDLSTQDVLQFVPPSLLGWDHVSTTTCRFNLDGFLVHLSERSPRNLRDTHPVGYTQIYRTGVIEAAFGLDRDYSVNMLPLNFGSKVARSFANHLKLLMSLGVQPPLVAAMSLIHAKDWRLQQIPVPDGVKGRYESFDRAHLILPEVLIEEFKGKAIELLRPIFDALWQAGGMDRFFESGPGWKMEDITLP